MSGDLFSSSMRLLVVDDSPAIRSSMTALLTELGYLVRSACDGFSALEEIRADMPNLLLSDLNMPGMSGFELLSVVRRRYPSIQVIAMSGAFSGEEVPSGVFADGFFQKGCSVRSLLRILEGLSQQKLRPSNPPLAASPLWIQRNGLNASGKPYVTIACTECLRTFHETVGSSLTPVREAHCIHCRNSTYFAIAEPVEWESERPSHLPSSAQIARAGI